MSADDTGDCRLSGQWSCEYVNIILINEMACRFVNENQKERKRENDNINKGNF